MESQQYNRIFLDAFPSWGECEGCQQLFKKNELRSCKACLKLLCDKCHRGHELRPISCLVVEV